MTLSRLVVAAVTVAALAAATAMPATGTASTTSHTWAPASSAAIRPGVQTITGGSQCTANFVFVDGADVYLGQAAHCAGLDDRLDTNGCQAGTLPLGTPVEIRGADHPGTLAYSSWLAMQVSEEADSSRCLYNDFALVRIHPADHHKVNPTVPFWGGPAGLAAAGSSSGDKVYSYGNSPLRVGPSPLSPKEGYRAGTSGGGWKHTVYTVSPGTPGDSGSGFVDHEGAALGVLSTLEVLPQAGSNGVSNLRRALDYLHHHTTIRARLALGTEPFRAGLLPPL